MMEDEQSHNAPPDTDEAAANQDAEPRETSPKVHPQPVAPAERVQAVDVLRGVALLGILTINIVVFAWPIAGLGNPRFSGGEHVGNVLAWSINSLVFYGKMMSLFSMLFGAGLVLMADRAAARGSSILGTYYRRIFWLLVIGLVHAYLIWSGDILVMYALCGLLLYPFRRRSPRTLVILGIVLIAIESAIGFGFMLYSKHAFAVAQQVDADVAAGRKSAQWQVELHRYWNDDMRSFVQPNQEDFEKEVDLYSGGYLDVVRGRAPELLMFQIFAFLWSILWGAGGRMLLGMGLMKLGFFSADRTWRFYRLMALFGYGVGVPLTVFGAVVFFLIDYNYLRSPVGALLFGLGIVPTALGHAALIMMVCKAGVFRRLTDRLAAVGRMALTNYLMQSIICTTLFYGYGAGLFGRVDRVGLWGIVLAIWGLQLVISPIWLKHYHYGPAEWLWRSLTYWRWRPMRSRASA